MENEDEWFSELVPQAADPTCFNPLCDPPPQEVMEGEKAKGPALQRETHMDQHPGYLWDKT